MPSLAALSFQRSPSPPKPPIKDSARSSFTVHKSTSSSRRFFSLTESSSCCSIAASLPMISARLSCFSLSASMIFWYSASASASASCFGATILATRSYESMAKTHLHRPAAAAAAFSAFSMV